MLWEESRVSFLVLGFVLLFFGFLLLYLGSGVKPQLQYLVWILYVPLSILFFALAIPYITAKHMKVTIKGVITGNKYVISQKNPGQMGFLVKLFKQPFRKSTFIPWNEINNANIKKVEFTTFIKIGQFIVPWSLYQDHVVLESKSKRFWIPLGQASVKYKKVDLLSLLRNKRG